MVAYARSSALLLTDLIQDPGNARWQVGPTLPHYCLFRGTVAHSPLPPMQTLFCTPLPVYDALLLMDHRRLPHPTRILFPAGGPSPRSPKGLPSPTPCTSLLRGFNPRDLLVQKLQVR